MLSSFLQKLLGTLRLHRGRDAVLFVCRSVMAKGPFLGVLMSIVGVNDLTLVTCVFSMLRSCENETQSLFLQRSKWRLESVRCSIRWKVGRRYMVPLKLVLFPVKDGRLVSSCAKRLSGASFLWKSKLWLLQQFAPLTLWLSVLGGLLGNLKVKC